MNLRTTTVLVVALVCWGPAAAQSRSDAGDGTRVRGAHEAARNPGRVYKDDLGLTVPGTPIEHPARVYPATDAFPTGPDVGERLPDFALPNQRGERIDFQRHRAGRKAVVAFVRSAVWCSYCMTQLVELQERIHEFRSAGFEVYAISYDPPAALRRFADRYAVTYNLLSDAGSEVIRRFGILNTLIDPGDRRAWPYYGVPFPGTYVTNESGIVTEKFFNRHYATRVSSATILDTALGRVLPRTESPVAVRRGRQVTATAVFSGTHLRPEVINTLHVRLALPDGLHVHAEPLPDGFFATTVSVKSSERIRVGRTVYPKTTPRHFAALGVALNVYEGVVDVQIPVALKANWESIPDVRARVGMPALNALDLDITVNYQACSETVCYRPDKVSVALRVPTAELIYPTPAQ